MIVSRIFSARHRRPRDFFKSSEGHKPLRNDRPAKVTSCCLVRRFLDRSCTSFETELSPSPLVAAAVAPASAIAAATADANANAAEITRSLLLNLPLSVVVIKKYNTSYHHRNRFHRYHLTAEGVVLKPGEGNTVRWDTTNKGDHISCVGEGGRCSPPLASWL